MAGRIHAYSALGSRTVTVGYGAGDLAPGQYDITAYGAQGGYASASIVGGRGAQISGEITLSPGEILDIVVGQAGRNGSFTDPYGSGGGGGGGSFVIETNGAGAILARLVIAGGGGGGGYAASPGYDANNGSGDGVAGHNIGGPSGAGGTAGSGGDNGAGLASGSGGGGGGINGDGGSVTFGGPSGGYSYLHGFNGGSGTTSGGNGGFGGGGGGSELGGGGGGGFSGGGGGLYGPGGGGGSFDADVSGSRRVDQRIGSYLNGYVVLTQDQTGAYNYATPGKVFVTVGDVGQLQPGFYDIAAFGGQGGGSNGGPGAKMEGNAFYLALHERLEIIVGGIGGTGTGVSGYGGGGGTFVIEVDDGTGFNPNLPLVIAGGGGGGSLTGQIHGEIDQDRWHRG